MTTDNMMDEEQLIHKVENYENYMIHRMCTTRTLQKEAAWCETAEVLDTSTLRYLLPDKTCGSS